MNLKNLKKKKKVGGGARNLKKQKDLKKESISKPMFPECLQFTKHLAKSSQTPYLGGIIVLILQIKKPKLRLNHMCAKSHS